MSDRYLKIVLTVIAGAADRVVIVGWEEGATRDRTMPMSPIQWSRGLSVPVRNLP
jgi:hypothetical protein